MDPARLRELLTALRDAGVKRAKVPFWHEVEPGQPSCAGLVFEVEFEPTPDPATPFADKAGKPLDLDEGAGLLARDPDADLESANFPRKNRGG